MLILTRKPGQGFTIGDDIEITITEVSGDKVKVGINAPRHVKVLRLELAETVEQNQQAAAKAAAGSLRALAAGLHRAGKAGEDTHTNVPPPSGQKEEGEAGSK